MPDPFENMLLPAPDEQPAQRTPILPFEGENELSRYIDISDTGIRDRIDLEIGRATYQLRADADRVKALPDDDPERKAFENFYARFNKYGEDDRTRFQNLFEAESEQIATFPQYIQDAVVKANEYREGAEAERQNYGFVESIIGEVAANPEAFAAAALLETAALATPVPPGVATLLAGGARATRWTSAAAQAARGATRLQRAGRAARAEGILGAAGGAAFGAYQHPQTEAAYAAVGAEFASLDNIALDTAAGGILGGGLGGLLGLFGKGIDPGTPGAGAGVRQAAGARFAVLLRSDEGVRELLDGLLARLPEESRKEIDLAGWDDLPLHIRQIRVTQAYSGFMNAINGTPVDAALARETTLRPATPDRDTQLLANNPHFTQGGSAENPVFEITSPTEGMRLYSPTLLDSLFGADGAERLINENGGIRVIADRKDGDSGYSILFTQNEVENLVTAKVYLPKEDFILDSDAAAALGTQRASSAQTIRSQHRGFRLSELERQQREALVKETTPPQAYTKAKRNFEKIQRDLEKGKAVTDDDRFRVANELQDARDKLEQYRTVRQEEKDKAKAAIEERKAQDKRDRAEQKRLEQEANQAEKDAADAKKREEKAQSDAAKEKARIEKEQRKNDAARARERLANVRKSQKAFVSDLKTLKDNLTEQTRLNDDALNALKGIAKDADESVRKLGVTPRKAKTTLARSELAVQGIERAIEDIDAPSVDVTGAAARQVDGTPSTDLPPPVGKSRSELKEELRDKLPASEQDVWDAASALDDMGIQSPGGRKLTMNQAVAVARMAQANAVSPMDILTTAHFGNLKLTDKNLGQIAGMRREYYNVLPNPQYSSTFILADVRKAAEAAEAAGKSTEEFRNDARIIADLKANPNLTVDELIYKYSPYETVNGIIRKVWTTDGIYDFFTREKLADLPKNADKPFSHPASKARSTKWNNLFVSEGFSAMGLTRQELAVTRALDAAKAAPELRFVMVVDNTGATIPNAPVQGKVFTTSLDNQLHAFQTEDGSWMIWDEVADLDPTADEALTRIHKQSFNDTDSFALSELEKPEIKDALDEAAKTDPKIAGMSIRQRVAHAYKLLAGEEGMTRSQALAKFNDGLMASLSSNSAEKQAKDAIQRAALLRRWGYGMKRQEIDNIEKAKQNCRAARKN